MSIRDEILGEQNVERRCGLGKALREMDPESREGVIEALHDRSLESTAITNWLKKQGCAVNRHQVGECRKSCDCGVIPDAST